MTPIETLLLAPKPASTKWLALMCLLMAISFLATACGTEEEVYTSPPTGTIAFTTDRDGNSEIYLMSADGSDSVNITNDEAEDREASWSADGSRLAFSSFRSGPANLYSMNSDGSDVQQLTDHPGVDGGARWSPDGSRIVFYSFRQQSEGLMWVMNADGSAPEPVLEDLTPAYPDTACGGAFPGGWMPDGQRILYRGSQGDISALQICSITQDGSDVKIIRSDVAVKNYFPSLSPDGRKIAFASDRDGNPEIYVMNANGDGLRRLTDHPEADEYPTWSPDGQWIAFQSDRDGDLEIYIVRPDGSGVRQLTDNDAADRQPAWSPQ